MIGAAVSLALGMAVLALGSRLAYEWVDYLFCSGREQHKREVIARNGAAGYWIGLVGALGFTAGLLLLGAYLVVVGIRLAVS